MAQALSVQEVERVARLSRLQLSATEVEMFSRELTRVLEYIDMLSEVDTESVAPLVHAIDRENVLRPDRPDSSLSRELAMSNAPDTDGKFFRVPRILDAS